MGALVTSLADTQNLAMSLSQSRKTPTGAPIPWTARPVTRFGQVVAPDYGSANQVVLVTYQVPVNWSALLYGVVLGFSSGSAPAPLPGDLVFTVDIDRPLGSTFGGYTEKDFNAVPYPLGSLVGGPYWPIEWQHASGETIRIKGYTVANVPTGAGSFLTAALLGWEWNTEGWEG